MIYHFDPRDIEQIIEKDLKPIVMNALWMLLLLQLAIIVQTLDSEIRNGTDQTLFRNRYGR